MVSCMDGPFLRGPEIRVTRSLSPETGGQGKASRRTLPETHAPHLLPVADDGTMRESRTSIGEAAALRRGGAASAAMVAGAALVAVAAAVGVGAHVGSSRTLPALNRSTDTNYARNAIGHLARVVQSMAREIQARHDALQRDKP